MPRGPEAEKTQVQAQAPIHASGGAAPPVRAQGSPTSEAAIEPDLPPSAPDAGQADTQATAGDRGVSGTTPRQTAVAPEQADTGADSGTDSDGDSEAGNAASARTGIDPPASAVNAGSVPDAGAPPAAAGSTAPPASEASDSPPERSASSPKSDAEPIPALTSTPPESAPSATGLGAFAVQVIGSRDKSAVYEFIEGLNIGLPRFVARTMHQGEPWYIGVVGAFDERDAALASLSKLPESLKKRRPWVKDMRGLEADRIDPITP